MRIIYLILSFNSSGQFCIGNGLSTHSNTEHTITIYNPVIEYPGYLPTVGTTFTNFSVNFNNYGFEPGTLDLPEIVNGVPVATATATVTVSTSTQLVITINDVSLPTTGNNGFDFPTESMAGTVKLSGGPGGVNYQWTWNSDRLNDCGPLPVTFISFGTQQYTSTSIKLQWTTADELNLSRYAVERSNNGYCFTQIGQVTASNTPGNHTYQFIDNQPFKNSDFYRLKSIDIDGHFKYSTISQRSCTSCTLGAPLATNCSSISIVGPTSVCSTAVYTLSGISNCAAATWSMGPLTNGTIVSNPVRATVTKTGNGPATITATVAGCTGSFTKTFTLGNPPPVIYTGVSKSLAFTRYSISITSPTLPSTSYTWYNNGVLSGTGYFKYYDVYPGDEGISYSVNKNDVCGVISVGGTLYYQAPVDPCAGPALFSATKASGSSTIVINSWPPCPAATSNLKTTSTQLASTPEPDYEVRLIDFQGTIVKSVNHVSFKNPYSMDVSRVVPGNYSVIVINRGVAEFSQKLRVD
jgi:hypothetical protein